jgi:hypothetical protein
VGERRLRCWIDVVELPPRMDHPNTIDGLRFAVPVSFSAALMSYRQRKVRPTG